MCIRDSDIHDSTAREWIRVGHALDELPLIHDAFARNELSYAKTRIVTRWADSENEAELLELAHDRTANRLTIAIAGFLAGEETDEERDQRHHDNRSVTTYTDADGMLIIRVAVAPNVGKHVVESLNTIIQQVAATPFDEPGEDLDASADAFDQQTVRSPATLGGQDASADASDGPTMREQLRELKQQWQPADDDGFGMPSLAQQRTDAFVLLFLGKNIELTTEVVICLLYTSDAADE